MFCPNCGTKNPDGAAFCSNCGTHLANVQAAKPAQPVQPVQPVQSVQIQQEPVQMYVQPKYTGWKKWVIFAGSLCGLLAVCVSFIFTFLIGVAVYPSVEGGFGDIRTEWGISYFFSGAFEDLIKTFEAIGEGTSFDLAGIMYTLYTAMFGSLIFMGFIIAMIVVFIKSIIRYIKHFKGTDDKGVSKLTTGMFFFYALGASLIASMFVTSSKYSLFGESGSAGIAYNGATNAGLAIGGILLAVFVASRIAVQGKNLLKLSVLIPGILTVCTLVFTAVVWSVAAGPLVGLAEDGVSQTFGFLPIIQNLRIDSSMLEGDVPEYVLNKIAVLGLSIAAWVLIVILLSITSKLATLTIRKLENPNCEGTGLGQAIAQLIFSVLVLIMSITLMGDDYKAAAFGSNQIDSNLSPVIVLLVMSVIVLGLTIANKIVTNNFKNKAVPVQQEYVSQQF